MKLRELLPIVFSLFFALEIWNLEVVNSKEIDRHEQTVSKMVVDMGLNQVQLFWLKNFTLSASAIDRQSP